MKPVLTVAGGLLGLLHISMLPAETDALSTVKARIAGFQEMGALVKSLRDASRDNDTQISHYDETATELHAFANKIETWFPEGTDSASVAALANPDGTQRGILARLRRSKTQTSRARPEIWTEPAKFAELSKTLVSQTATLKAAAERNDRRKVQAWLSSVQRTCKSCHDTYRFPDD